MMRKEFLRMVAESFLKEDGSRLQEYCFVFPNNRSSLFFKRYLMEKTDRPIFAPEMVTINDLFASLSGRRCADKLTLLSILYRCYAEVAEGFSQPFDEFLYWGDMLLGDFDDIDKYLVSAEDLFTNIADLKELDDFSYLTPEQRKAIGLFWGTLLDRTGDAEKQFYDLWQVLSRVYTVFGEKLRSSGLSYEGMIYRDVAERIGAQDPSLEEYFGRYRKFVFVGLNALNECEKKLFDYLKLAGKGDYYWDYYGKMITDPENRSSVFMRNNVRNYPASHPLPDGGGLPDQAPEMEVIAVPSAVGQAKYVKHILEEIAAEGKDDGFFSTAVVLPDENLLFPLLNSIPESVPKLNVTMGYTLSGSNVSSLVSQISALLLRRKEKDGVRSFHFRTVLDLLANPYVKKAFPPELIASCRRKILAGNLVYVPEDLFHEMTEQDLSLSRLFAFPGDSLPDYLRERIEWLAGYADEVEKEFFLGYYRCINQLEALHLDIRENTWFRLLRQISASISIPFSGEPLAGLQIMGPLETRALDFENVILLSVNEGTFPSANSAPTLIPYHLRKGFGLPTYEFQDSISAYHFYRSICRARRVFLIYDSRTEGLRSGEESRYVRQLEYHHRMKPVRKSVSYSLRPVNPRRTSFPKTDQVMELLLKKSYSPSAIDAYMTCPVKFYYAYVENLKEEEELSEEIDPSRFGTLFHRAMQLLYDPLAGRIFSDDFYGEIRKESVDKAVQQAFSDVLKTEAPAGRNRIVQAMIREFVQATVRKDAQTEGGTFSILKTEGKHEAELILDDGRAVRLNGIIDRLDRRNAGYRVLDYKTGALRDHFDPEHVEQLLQAERFRESKNLFQLFYYLVILLNEQDPLLRKPEGTRLSLYYTRNSFSRETSDVDVTQEQYEVFLQELKKFFQQDLLDREKEFTMTEDTENCGFCPYRVICNR